MGAFQKQYWTPDNSTSAVFEPCDTVSEMPVTAVMVCAFTDDGKLAFSRPSRGWGLPGGHVEEGETIEQCARRELIEEAGVEVGELKLVGRWSVAKEFNSEYNKKYPDTAQQLLYIADVVNIHHYESTLEVLERAFFTVEEAIKNCHDPEAFTPVMHYVKERYERKENYGKMCRKR